MMILRKINIEGLCFDAKTARALLHRGGLYSGCFLPARLAA
jgi:hypothetical protein